MDSSLDHSRSSVATSSEELGRWLAELRPKLHRYCTRMTGSVIDGEDAVQDTMIKAFQSFPGFEALSSPQAWLFRVAHNASLDVLRDRARRSAGLGTKDMNRLPASASTVEQRIAAGAGLRTFMLLTPAQRSCVILMDVLGYSLEEISQIIGRSVVAVKAALHRGRVRLRELSNEADSRSVVALSQAERGLLTSYIDLFNERDFDAVRDMLAEEVRLDLVGRTRMNGKAEVGTYLHNYANTADWRLVLGSVEGHPAVIVRSPKRDADAPLYFILLKWDGEKLTGIRDFRYARYVIEDADVRTP
jgi:RNA polymerase sigma-70 factor, ECF subfamily